MSIRRDNTEWTHVSKQIVHGRCIAITIRTTCISTYTLKLSYVFQHITYYSLA